MTSEKKIPRILREIERIEVERKRKHKAPIRWKKMKIKK